MTSFRSAGEVVPARLELIMFFPSRSGGWTDSRQANHQRQRSPTQRKSSLEKKKIAALDKKSFWLFVSLAPVSHRNKESV